MVSFINRYHSHACVFLLCLIISAPLLCSSSHSLLRNQKEVKHGVESTLQEEEEDVIVATQLGSSTHHRQQQQQQLLLQKQEHERMAQAEDYCKLCPGGINILADKTTSPGITCGDMDNYYRYAWPDPTNITMNNMGTCRADIGYNFHVDLCCKASIPKYECEESVHELLFGDDALVPYNTAVPPIVSIDEPLNVGVMITYQALENIEVELGTATIFVDVELTWNDPRLKWNVVDWDTCTNVIDVFAGHDIETTTIWLPDFDLLNQVDGMQSAPQTKASIYSDGTVRWVISGGLEAFCAFSGLANIPFDKLGCQLLFGSKTRSYSQQIRYVLTLPDFVGVGAFELTYNEWTIDELKTEQGTTFNGNVIYYNLYFTRATRYYLQNIVAPTMMLTYLSFFTFLLDMRVGERLGFGMALALVIVAQQIVTTDLSPVSNQLLWLDKFVAWSFYWVLFGVLQSVIIGFMFYIQEDKLEKEEKTERRSMLLQLEDLKRAEEAAEESVALADGQEGDVSQKNETKSAPKKGCLYTASLRKIDLISLAFAVATYTAYVIIMFSTVSSGAWLSNEPRRFNESDIAYPLSYYNAKDPNT